MGSMILSEYKTMCLGGVINSAQLNKASRVPGGRIDRVIRTDVNEFPTLAYQFSDTWLI